MKNLFEYISFLLGEPIISHNRLTGGDISESYILSSNSNRYFCKINENSEANSMFETEKVGLQLIEKTKTISVPEVLVINTFKNKSFLILEYIQPANTSRHLFETFGAKLAELHNARSDFFGLDSDNYIGSLHQSNKKHMEWGTFYINERLIPQFKLAVKNNLLAKSEIPNEDTLNKFSESYFINIKTSLLHGDLWSGNYLFSEDRPYLIDPSVYFGHNLVDIAMSKLFGGFDQSFYHSYEEEFPNCENYDLYIDIYQLYYLLVHLNLFGRGYYDAVKRTIRRYFI